MPRIEDIPFSDIYITPDNSLFIHDGKTKYGLQKIEADDFNEFKQSLVKSWKGKSSYSMIYDQTIYRVEKVEAIVGTHYSVRRMPRKTPDFTKLGFPPEVYKYLISLNRASGLLLWGGATGTGKTTSISCLVKKFLEREGGFCYTIEDPPEMPLDGVYQSQRGGLALCKQTEPPNGDWGEGLKSALRSKPRYILVGEIRTPETATQVLRAATSGHLVLSTIHANSVEDALNSMIKYATASGINDNLAADLLSRGILGVIQQKLEGETSLSPDVSFCFANPNPSTPDQMRIHVRDMQLHLGTLMEAQLAKLMQGRPLFRDAPPTLRDQFE